MIKTKSRKILIIDDEPALLTALVDKFSRAGYEVIVAVDGQQGLKLAFREHPDMILLDIIMPVMDGLTMLYKLRRNHWGKYVNVILLTNLSDPGNVNKPLTRAVNGYLVKSDWKIEEVVKEVNEKLAK